ncbi:hypothetical protein CWM47_37790 [Spirosoma pollinicola]|uniref:Uncharacterized protein n=1 Tax=Spirosoma pollinicola TaxID=2057025 RepID=A0A2K8ZB15_9BACT|nr:hypothetical protein CWM47_37790 [Spirosoma pollinicola]
MAKFLALRGYILYNVKKTDSIHSMFKNNVFSLIKPVFSTYQTCFLAYQTCFLAYQTCFLAYQTCFLAYI